MKTKTARPTKTANERKKRGFQTDSVEIPDGRIKDSGLQPLPEFTERQLTRAWKEIQKAFLGATPVGRRAFVTLARAMRHTSPSKRAS